MYVGLRDESNNTNVTFIIFASEEDEDRLSQNGRLLGVNASLSASVSISFKSNNPIILSRDCGLSYDLINHILYMHNACWDEMDIRNGISVKFGYKGCTSCIFIFWCSCQVS